MSLAEIPDYPNWLEEVPHFSGWHESAWKFILSKLRDPTIFAIRGTGRSGKRALGYYLLEKAHEQDQTPFIIGGNSSEIPDWITFIPGKDVKQIDERYSGKRIVLVDDIGAMGLTARRSSKTESKELQEFSTVISHKNITMIVSIQNLRMLDVKGLLVAQSSQLIHKFSDMFSMKWERENIKEELQHSQKFLEWILKEYHELPQFNDSEHQAKGLAYHINTGKPFYNPLPSFYSDDISKSFNEVNV